MQWFSWRMCSIFKPKKITISCFNYRTLYVKQPNVASGVQPETKPLKNNGKKRVKCNVVLYYLALLLLNVCTHCNYYFYGFLFYKVFFVFVTPPKKHTYTAPPNKTVLHAVSTVTLLKEHRIFNSVSNKPLSCARREKSLKEDVNSDRLPRGINYYWHVYENKIGLLIIRVQYIITFIQYSDKVKSICLSFQSTMRWT